MTKKAEAAAKAPSVPPTATYRVAEGPAPAALNEAAVAAQRPKADAPADVPVQTEG